METSCNVAQQLDKWKGQEIDGQNLSSSNERRFFSTMLFLPEVTETRKVVPLIARKSTHSPDLEVVIDPLQKSSEHGINGAKTNVLLIMVPCARTLVETWWNREIFLAVYDMVGTPLTYHLCSLSIGVVNTLTKEKSSLERESFIQFILPRRDHQGGNLGQEPQRGSCLLACSLWLMLSFLYKGNYLPMNINSGLGPSKSVSNHDSYL